MNMTAIGYVRVSTDKQDNSMDAQERLIRAQAMLKGLELSEVISDRDEFSGNLDRPGVQRVLELVKGKKVGAVIISKLDRLTRSTRDAIDLIELFGKKDVALISVAESLDTESPMGRFFVRMIASIAELEREMIGSRTSAGLQNLKAQGMPAGPAPYGWRSVGKKLPMIEEEAEQVVLARIKALRASGLSLPAISSTLNAEGLRTRRGTEWRYQYVAGVLKTAGAQSVAS
jgi:site-specific DNA recombinase